MPAAPRLVPALRACFGLGALRACLCLAALLTAASSVHAQVTFNKQIAPIVFEYCSACHHAGEAAPFALMNYADVRQHANQIVAVTKIRFMPPWPPQHGYGDFAGERRLSEDRKSVV